MMASGPGKPKILFCPTRLPGPPATPTVVTGASAATGPGKYS